MSGAEYLEWERAQATKHEYHCGEIFAMAGGSMRHNMLAISIASELRSALRERGCRVLSSDQRIGTPDERYVYPDAVAVCGPIRTEPDAPDVLVNPTIVVEVLSPSTEAYDRGDKWDAYQRSSSLTDYLLVSQTQVRIECFHREADGSWRYRVLGAGETIELAGASVSLDAIYDGAFELDAG